MEGVDVDVDGVRLHFSERVSQMSEALALSVHVASSSGADEEVEERREECFRLMEELNFQVDDMTDVLSLFRIKIDQQRKVLDDVKSLKKKVEKIASSVKFTAENLPPHLPQPTQMVPDAVAKAGQVPKQQNPAPSERLASAATVGEEGNCSKGNNPTHADKPKQRPPCPLMEYLTVDEFKDVPKYMKGHLSYQRVNSVIDEMNKVLTTKYKLMRQKRTAMSDINRKRYEKLKEQESKDTKGMYFVVQEDMKEWSSLKLSKETNTILTVLRHCGRLCEIRGGGLVRYAVIDMY